MLFHLTQRISLDNMEEQCSICCDSYLIPRLLNCLHYFCQCCIESVQTNDIIKCPICGEETSFLSG